MPRTSDFEIEQAVLRRNRLHGHEWPRGVSNQLSLQLKASYSTIQMMRLELLLHAVREEA